MKRTGKIVLVLLGVLALGFGFAFFVRDQSKRAVNATRRELRAQGFKTDLEDFDFAAGSEMRLRTAHIMRAMTEMAAAERRELKDEAVNTACAALFSGPIAFDYFAENHGALYEAHAGQLQSLARILAGRTLLDLHNNDRDGVWFNVIALSRIATAWEPGPGEEAHSMRCRIVRSAFEVICQALHAGGWRDEQLVDLQTEWASVDFFKNVPDAIAFTGARKIWECQSQRTNSVGGKIRFADILASPKMAWTQFRARSQAQKFRDEGSYEEEKQLLLFYRDRQLEVRRALKETTWLEMRKLQGITNAPVFQSKKALPPPTATGAGISTQAVLRIGRALSPVVLGPAGVVPQIAQPSALEQAAEAETLRRMLLTATGLERQKLRKQSYPKTIAELSPTTSPAPVVDFMDGKPFRYRLVNDGHFILYSVGLDCVDNGGIGNGRDMIWPAARSL
jgi:hypothetical protein